MSDAGRAPADADRDFCSLPRRCLIILYDALVVLALLFIAGLAALPFGSGQWQALRDPLFTVYLLAIWFAYVAWCWTHGGQTIGMRAWRTRIEDGCGGLPDWPTSGVRFAAALLSAVCLGAGFLWALTNQESACWHDRISATRLRLIKPNAEE